MLTPVATRVLPVALLLLAGLACSADSKLADNATVGAPDTGLPGTNTTTDSGLSTTTNQPVFFAVDGILTVTNDDVDLGQSTVSMDYRNAAGDSIDCTEVRTLSTATLLVNDDPDLPLFGWWDVTFEASVDCPYGPDALTLGIGAWDNELDAAAAAKNLIGSELYTLYARQSPTSPVFSFGAAGTSEQFNGTTPPATEAPLPDGVYQLRTLFLLTVDPP